MSRRSKLRRALFKKERYHQGPTPLDNESREQRRQSKGKQFIFKRRVIAATLLLTIGVFTYFFGFIRGVEVNGLNDSTAAEIKKLAGSYFDQSWYKRFKPLADIDALSGSIELADSRFSGTQATVDLFSEKVVISSTVRQPVAKWRTPGDENVYLVDADGIVYRDHQVDSGGLPVIVDATGLKVILGTQLTSTTTLDFIRLLGERLDHEGLFGGQSRAYVLTTSPKEVQMEVNTAGYLVKFTTARSASDQAAELKATLEHLDDLGVTPSSYIDLRIDDTAYYR